MKLEYIISLCGLAVFFIVILIAVLRDRKNAKQKPDFNEDEWLFSGWTEKVYRSITTKDPRELAVKVGIDAEKYIDSCRLLAIEPRLEDLVVKKLTGIICMFFFLLLAVLTKNYIFCGILAAFGAILALFSGKRIENDAEERKMKLESELPRFLDLLQTALYINLPIEEAIMVTAKSMRGTVLAEEFLLTITDVRIGSRDWQESLEVMARRYQIDEFSDFVLDLTISYKKGLSIYDTVVRRNRDIKQSSLLTMKEKAAKLNSTMIIPIVIFDLIPMLAIMMIPIVQQLNSDFF